MLKIYTNLIYIEIGIPPNLNTFPNITILLSTSNYRIVDLV